MVRPWLGSLISEQFVCRLQGGIPAYDESGNFAKWFKSSLF